MQIDGSPGAYFAGISDGEHRYLAFRFELRTTRHKSQGKPGRKEIEQFPRIQRDTKFLVLLADGSIVELQSDSVSNNTSVWPSYAIDEDSGFEEYRLTTTAVARYALNVETLAALTAQGYTDLRVSTSNGDMDFSKSKPAKEIQAVLACIQ